MDITPSGYLSQIGSLIWGLGLGLALPLGLFVLALRRWRSSASEARAAAAAEEVAMTTKRIEPGEHVLYGTVARVYDGGDEAMRLDVRQERRATKQPYWDEVSRSQQQRPFELALASGLRLRVEPDAATRLIDDLDGLEPVDERTRVRIARLTVGESVFAVCRVDDGEGAGPYRGGAAVARARSSTPLVLSTRPLDEALGGRARVYRLWTVLLLLGALGTLALFGDYFFDLVVARPRVAKVVSLSYSTAKVELDGRVITLPHGAYGNAKRAWVRCGWGRCSLGRHARLHSNRGVLMGSLLWLILVAGFVGHLATKRTWYDGGMVIDLGDTAVSGDAR